MDPARASCGRVAHPGSKFFAMPVAGKIGRAGARAAAGGRPPLGLPGSGFDWTNTRSHHRRSPTAYHSVAQESGEVPTVATVPVKFKVLHPTEFGESIKVVGGGDVLGEWEVDSAVGLEWHDDDVWTVDTALAPGTYEFKCVKVCGDSSVVWEPGANRTLEVPEQPAAGGMLEVDCLFWDTLSTSSSMSMDEGDEVELEEVEESNGNGIDAESSSAEVTEGETDVQADEVSETAQEESSMAGATAESSSSEVEAEIVNVEGKEETQQEAEVATDDQEKEGPKDDVMESVGDAETSVVTAKEADEPRKLSGVQPGSAAGAKSSQVEATSSGLVDAVVTIGGIVSIPIMAWSLFALKTTGCGLPPGPGGLLGGLEGVSYLAVLAIAGRALLRRRSAGTTGLEGLPPSSAGLVGLVETMSFATLLAGVVVLGTQVLDYGYIPSALPDENCSTQPTPLTFPLQFSLLTFPLGDA